MAKLPNKIKIGNRQIQVRRVKELRTDNGHPALGKWSPEDQTLFLVPHNSLDDERDTVLHEVFHALFTYFHMSPKDEERIVSCLASGFLAAAQDNPKLMRYLFNDN